MYVQSGLLIVDSSKTACTSLHDQLSKTTFSVLEQSLLLKTNKSYMVIREYMFSTSPLALKLSDN